MKRERFFIIDAFAHIFRAFYAVRGIDNNAVFGFTTMLRKLLNTENPEYVAVAFDTPSPSFRKKIFPEYKSNRQAMPEDLIPQIPLIREVVEAFKLPIVELPGYEADDVMGALAIQAADQGYQAVIVSGDKDMLQMVSGDRIVIYDSKKDVLFLDESQVPAYFGCKPQQIIDLLTIWGDSADNIPGVPGVGEKGAKKLLETYGSLDGIYENLHKIKRKAYREGFEKARENIPLTRKLVTICTDLDLKFEAETFRNQGADGEKLQELFTRLNFKTLLKDVPIDLKSCDREYQSIESLEDLESWIGLIKERNFFIFDVETTSLDPKEAQLVGVALAVDEKHIGYLPLRHEGQSVQWATEAEALLRPIMADPGIVKCAHNAKYDMSVLFARGWDLAGTFEDTMLMSYLIRPSDTRHGLDDLAETLLHYRTIKFAEVCGSGKEQITFDRVAVPQASRYAAEDADICLRLYHRFHPDLKEQRLMHVYEAVERPLVPVLARMELAGIRVNVEYLEKMSAEMAREIEVLEEQIYEAAGERFNIKSTKQLGAILFEKMGLTSIKKTTKTKSYSTDQTVLERLTSQGHELPAKLLEYRMLTKLKSTYVDALPGMIHAITGRVHSSFAQFVTATGRLSSNSPNLQNIPIRTELGREIRAAFVPAEGCLFVAADYSQIELRIMAHFSGDKTLVAAFRAGEDIHRRTAGEIMDVLPELVSSEMRAMAKSINFGLIYGMGDFRLAQELNITRKEARKYIETYFKKMPGVLTFRDQVIEKARQDGQVRTFSDRKRDLPEINSRNKNLKNQGERLAVNTLIQGSAAEVIKLAMIRLDREIRERGLAARLLLQVHDELVLECPVAEEKEVCRLLRETMEGVVDFSVPLTVDLHTGTNWKETK